MDFHPWPYLAEAHASLSSEALARCMRSPDSTRSKNLRSERAREIRIGESKRKPGNQVNQPSNQVRQASNQASNQGEQPTKQPSKASKASKASKQPSKQPRRATNQATKQGKQPTKQATKAIKQPTDQPTAMFLTVVVHYYYLPLMCLTQKPKKLLTLEVDHRLGATLMKQNPFNLTKHLICTWSQTERRDSRKSIIYIYVYIYMYTYVSLLEPTYSVCDENGR